MIACRPSQATETRCLSDSSRSSVCSVLESPTDIRWLCVMIPFSIGLVALSFAASCSSVQQWVRRVKRLQTPFSWAEFHGRGTSEAQRQEAQSETRHFLSALDTPSRRCWTPPPPSPPPRASSSTGSLPRRSDAGADQRPAGRGAHRNGHAVGSPRPGGGGGPGGQGQERLPERRGQEQPPGRPAA